MNFRDIINILWHTWRIYANSKMLFTLVAVLMPLVVFIIFVSVPLSVVYFNGTFNTGQAMLANSTAYNMTDVPDAVGVLQNVMPNYNGLLPGVAMIIYNNDALIPFAALLISEFPMMIAGALFTIEKNRELLEPVLVTPVKTSDYILGKCLSTVLIPTVPTFIAILLACIADDLVLYPTGVLLPDSAWIFWLFIVTPLTIILCTMITFIGMSMTKKNSPLPMLLGLFGNPVFFIMLMYGNGDASFLNPVNYTSIVIAMLILDFGFLQLAVHTFNREEIVARMRS